MNDVTEDKAWEALDRKDYPAAADLWEQLIGAASNEVECDAFKNGYGYALIGLKRFDDARAIYLHLYKKTQSHIYIHQLGMVERESGEYDRAATIFKQEQSMLTAEDNLAVAANLYEQGLVESLVGNMASALEHANRCLVVSLDTEDKIMHGCAYRLLGDLWRHYCPGKACSYYHKSRRAFEGAEDEIACGEIDDRLETITQHVYANSCTNMHQSE